MGHFLLPKPWILCNNTSSKYFFGIKVSKLDAGLFWSQGSMLWTYARDMKSWFQTVQEPIEGNYKDDP